jgi:hypothetical protein
LWNWIGIFFSIEFGMLSGPGALLLPRFLRHRSYVFLSNVFAMEAFDSPLFSRIKPSRSCQGYCLTLHTHTGSWFSLW